MTTFCPDCEAVIPLGRFQCRCGAKIERKQIWNTPEEVAYDGEATRKAEAVCKALGLTTTEEKRAYIRSLLPQLGRERTLAQKRAWMENPKSEYAKKLRDEVFAERRITVREPGADYEEDEFRDGAA